MKANLKVLSQSVSINLETDNIKDLVKHLSFLQQLPDACPKCGADIHFNYRFVDGNDFYGLECAAGHSTTFGQFKEGPVLFYKPREEWQKWGSQQEDHAPTQPQQTQAQAATGDFISAQTASDFFAEYRQKGFKSEAIRPHVEAVNPSAVKDLTKLSHKELEQVKRSLDAPLKAKKLKGNPIHKNDGVAFDDLR